MIQLHDYVLCLPLMCIRKRNALASMILMVLNICYGYLDEVIYCFKSISISVLLIFYDF